MKTEIPAIHRGGQREMAGALVDRAIHNLSAEEIYARLLQGRSEGNGAPKPPLSSIMS
jgi:hypothetical protein